MELLLNGGIRRAAGGVLDRVRSSASRKRIHVMAAIAATLTAGILAYRVLFSFGCRFTPESESETTARMLRDAATTWQAVTRVATCPTVADLKRSMILDPGVTVTDTWGNSFQLQCSSVDVRVISAGPDRKRGSEDDVVVPKAAR